jgi:tetratricopeptide (TPR) repeat protein
MLCMRLARIILILIFTALLVLLLYQVPYVKYHVGWRLDAARAYLRGVIDPVSAVPTALPAEGIVITKTPSPQTTSTAAGKTTTPLPTATPLPSIIALPAPEWEEQDWNNCGPATLAMYLRYYGWEGDQFDISNKLRTERNDRNINVEELDHYVRNNAGWLNIIYRVAGDIQLLKNLLANGIPVMIEEGDTIDGNYWPDDDHWAGHYLLITGYDDSKQSFTGQDSFRGPDRQVSYSETDARWQAFNRVYIVVFHPTQEETVKLVLGEQWDSDHNRQYALEFSQTETEADPENAFAWFNLGTNLVFFERYAEAAQAYDTARGLDLPQRMFRYQFGPFFAYFHANRLEDLQLLIDYALRITENSEEAWLWRGWALYRQGDEAGAVAAFRESYRLNPLSVDAQYALEFMGASP